MGTRTSVTRHRASVVSSPCDTPSSTVSSPTGTTWRRSGTTPSTTSSVSHQRSTRVILNPCLCCACCCFCLVAVLREDFKRWKESEPMKRIALYMCMCGVVEYVLGGVLSLAFTGGWEQPIGGSWNETHGLWKEIGSFVGIFLSLCVLFWVRFKPKRRDDAAYSNARARWEETRRDVAAQQGGDTITVTLESSTDSRTLVVSNAYYAEHILRSLVGSKTARLCLAGVELGAKETLGEHEVENDAVLKLTDAEFDHITTSAGAVVTVPAPFVGPEPHPQNFDVEMGEGDNISARNLAELRNYECPAYCPSICPCSVARPTKVQPEEAQELQKTDSTND